MYFFIARMRSFGLRKTIKKRWWQHQTDAYTQFTIKIYSFRSCKKKNYKRFSHSVAQWDETEQQHQQNTTNHHRSCVKKFIIISIEIRRSHVLGSHDFSIHWGRLCVCLFFNSSRRWLLMFSLCSFFFDANYLNGTHRPQVSTGIFYNTHTQQQTLWIHLLIID